MDKELKQLTPEELEMINGGLVVVCPGYDSYVVDDNTGAILTSSPHVIEAMQLAARNGVSSHAITPDEYEQRFGRSFLDMI